MNSMQKLLEYNSLAVDSTVFFLCDMQEKFRPAIYKFDEIAQICNRLVC